MYNSGESALLEWSIFKMQYAIPIQSLRHPKDIIQRNRKDNLKD